LVQEGSQQHDNAHWRFLFGLFCRSQLKNCLDVATPQFLIIARWLWTSYPVKRQQGLLHRFHPRQLRTNGNGKTL